MPTHEIHANECPTNITDFTVSVYAPLDLGLAVVDDTDLEVRVQGDVGRVHVDGRCHAHHWSTPDTYTTQYDSIQLKCVFSLFTVFQQYLGHF